MIAPRLSAVLVVGLPLLYAACGSDNLTLPGEGEPAHITIVAGDSQSVRVGSQLAPLVVKVTDTKDRPVAGATVEFVFDDAAASGTITPSGTTGSDGQASATITLGDQVGAANGHASVAVPQGTVPVSIAFTATALPDNANGLAPVSGNEQSGPVGSALPQPLVVQVTDQFFNPIAGVTVNWSVTGGGSVSAASTVTGADGKTQVTRTLGNTAGPQTTLASSQDLAGSPVTFTHTATAGSANRVIKLSGDNQSAVAGSQLPNPLVVQVLDAQNNPVPNRAVTWVIGAGGGSANPQNSSTDADGKASTQWTVGAQGNNTLNAVVSGVGTATFSATATAGTPSASKSTVSASPRAITAGVTTSTITVRVRDASGNPVRGVSVTVTGSGSGNSVDPTPDTSDDNGVATFTFGSIVAEVKTITAVAGGVTLDQKPTITVVKALSRTRIGPHDPNPSTAGQSVHVLFSVSSDQGGGIPTGTVTIISDKEQTPGSTCNNAPLDASGQGSCDITLTVVGTHNLMASYIGDGRFDSSNDNDPHTVNVNQAPVAVNDAYATPGAGQSLTVPAATGVLANDNDPDRAPAPLTARNPSTPAKGSVTLNPDGSFTYTPSVPGPDTDTFTYEAFDGALASSATVTITIQ